MLTSSDNIVLFLREKDNRVIHELSGLNFRSKLPEDIIPCPSVFIGNFAQMGCYKVTSVKTGTKISFKALSGVLVLMVITLFLYTVKGEAMSLIKGKEVYVFSAMEGTITYQGKPAAGAKIVRKVRWKDEE